MNICIVIPVHNEARTIGPLIDALKAKNLEAFIIDDGSEDDSGIIAQKKNVNVLRHDKKRGKGISLRDGFAYALERDYEGIIAMDGDGQHDTSDLDQFIAKAKEYPASVIVGTRMQNAKGMPLIRFIVNRVMSSMISSICHQKIPDTQCGFRYIGRDVLEKMDLSCSDFEIETEVLVKAHRQGFKIHSVPIKTIYRRESSKINPFVDTIRFFVYIIKEAWFPKP